MGRTVPSFRIAEAQEVGEWKAFRRALPRRERPIFDEMLSAARLYTSASSAALRTSRFEGMAMAVIFHHWRFLSECTSILTELNQGRAEVIRLVNAEGRSQPMTCTTRKLSLYSHP